MVKSFNHHYMKECAKIHLSGSWTKRIVLRFTELLARFPTKWQHIGTYACWIDCPIDHKVRTRSTGEIFVRMTKYIAPRMLDVHGRSIIEWQVIDSPNVRWNEVHRFGCVIRLHVNLYMAYCRKNISRSCWREIYLISKSNTKLFY